MFTAQEGSATIEARYEDETVWLSQSLMAELFDTTQQSISAHLRAIYLEGELDERSTHKKFLSVRREGGRQVRRSLEHYKLDAYDLGIGKCGSARIVFRVLRIMPLASEVMRQSSGQLLINQKRSHEDESSNADQSC